MRLKVADFFSGIGGFSLGLERTGGFKTVSFCEQDLFCQKVLTKHWPDVPIHDDIIKFTNVDAEVFCGGFPCQPFSTAPRGRITAVDLWPEFARVVWLNRPTIVIAENVGIKPITQVKNDLELLGYRCETRCIGAHEAGADHKRDRWWAIAHTNHQSKLFSALDAEMAKLPELCKGVWGEENYTRAIRIPNGLPDRMDRLKCLGNSVIPQIPEAIGHAILAGDLRGKKERGSRPERLG